METFEFSMPTLPSDYEIKLPNGRWMTKFSDRPITENNFYKSYNETWLKKLLQLMIWTKLLPMYAHCQLIKNIITSMISRYGYKTIVNNEHYKILYIFEWLYKHLGDNVSIIKLIIQIYIINYNQKYFKINKI